MATGTKGSTTRKGAPKAPKAPQEAPQAEKRPRGRQTIYTDEIAQRIFEGLSKGTPLTVICSEPGMPQDRTVRDWIARDENFAAEIARAREQGFDRIALDALQIADETSNDTISTEQGDRPNNEWIARSKLRIETRLKLLAKWDPKRYGERTTQEVTGEGGGPVQVSVAVRFVDAPARADDDSGS